MAVLKTRKTKITGVCCALPLNGRSVYDVGAGHFDAETIGKVVGPVGTETLYFAADGQTASDLCFAAAERLISSAGIAKDEIDGVIFVSQTPDYRTPATACMLQDRLGLPRTAVAMDLNFGCSGFVYGAFTAASFVESGACSKLLVLNGDTLRRHTSLQDKGMAFILSDAGSAVLIEASDSAEPMTFSMNTDGSGYGTLIIPAGGERLPKSEKTSERRLDGDGSARSDEDFYMDGMGVFTFAVREVPLLIDGLASLHGIAKDGVDDFLFHQANAYMLKFIAKRAGIPMDKVHVNIGRYGNTNGSTIPFLLADFAAGGEQAGRNVIMAGFGVGLSWGGIAGRLGTFRCAEIISV
ncbi:MAG: ketoacyl-ACP synthase III [Clostridiales Family XIII bacterium]|jgi:3-oxoacyl-[acyl-carrier-protein] synthase-3|nr:ketoacyl-ACP synthase III [Clostridiales Family XIII bacterium]